MDLWNGLVELMTCKKLGTFKEYCGIAGYDSSYIACLSTVTVGLYGSTLQSQQLVLLQHQQFILLYHAH